jgi:Ca2+-binding EF-hand superfamily protein
MMNKIDVNHDGRINLLEFIHLFEDMIARIELTNNARLKFAEFDVDKSGFLEASEIDRLVDVVLTTYVEKSPTERKKFHKTLLSRVDKNKDKKLDFGEFLKVWEMVMIRQDMIECARGKFRTLDKDGSGFLEKDELKPVLLEWISSSKDNTDVDLDTATRDLVEAIDANKDGKLDLLEFMVIFETTMANEGFWGIREPSM